MDSADAIAIAAVVYNPRAQDRGRPVDRAEALPAGLTRRGHPNQTQVWTGVHRHSTVMRNTAMSAVGAIVVKPALDRKLDLTSQLNAPTADRCVRVPGHPLPASPQQDRPAYACVQTLLMQHAAKPVLPAPLLLERVMTRHRYFAPSGQCCR